MIRIESLLTSERDALMRHRANVVASALWGLYNASPQQSEPRRWTNLAPRVLTKGSGGGGGGSVLTETGEGTKTLSHNRIPTQKGGAPSYLWIRVPSLVVRAGDDEREGKEYASDLTPLLDFPQHELALFRSDYEDGLSKLAPSWFRSWKSFERAPYLCLPFQLVVKGRLRSARFRVGRNTDDGTLCASLLFAELASLHEVESDAKGRVHFS